MITLGLSQHSFADRNSSLSSTVENEPEQTIVEVLAESATRDGQGEIQVLRHPGDGISVVQTFPLGYRYEIPVIGKRAACRRSTRHCLPRLNR